MDIVGMYDIVTSVKAQEYMSSDFGNLYRCGLSFILCTSI